MKIHKLLVEQVIYALEEIFDHGQYADKTIERAMKHHRKWGSRDRKFFAETVYEILRWKRLLVELAGDTDYWKVFGAYFLRKGEELPDWEEFHGLTLAKVQEREKKITNVAISQSIPDWMYERGLNEIGKDFDSIVRALNVPAEVYLRTNTLKIQPDELIKQFATEGVEVEKVSADLPLALKMKERKNVFATEAFKKGYFEVQDAASQMVAQLMDLEPGMRVVDACAGAGGKSLHIATFLKNKGKILSLDIHEWKLKELKTRAKRNGVDVIETRVIDSNKVIKRLAESADRVLLDVPCSGIGVLRRNPDAKWKLSNEEIGRLEQLQFEILTTYSQMTKKGGKLVYATCSLLPSENERQVQKFMAENGEHWKLVKELHVRPDTDGYDGFYAALLQRL